MASTEVLSKWGVHQNKLVCELTSAWGANTGLAIVALSQSKLWFRPAAEWQSEFNRVGVEWHEWGRLFNDDLEVYWRRIDDEHFAICVTADSNACKLPDYEALEGADSWERQDYETYLWGTAAGPPDSQGMVEFKEGRIPHSLQYPAILSDGKRARLRVREYRNEYGATQHWRIVGVAKQTEQKGEAQK